jgi:hypothetical protein
VAEADNESKLSSEFKSESNAEIPPESELKFDLNAETSSQRPYEVLNEAWGAVSMAERA